MVETLHERDSSFVLRSIPTFSTTKLAGHALATYRPLLEALKRIANFNLPSSQEQLEGKAEETKRWIGKFMDIKKKYIEETLIFFICSEVTIKIYYSPLVFFQF